MLASAGAGLMDLVVAPGLCEVASDGVVSDTLASAGAGPTDSWALRASFDERGWGRRLSNVESDKEQEVDHGRQRRVPAAGAGSAAADHISYAALLQQLRVAVSPTPTAAAAPP